MLPPQRIEGGSGDMGLRGEFSSQVAREQVSPGGHTWHS